MSLTDRTKPTDVSLNTDLYELTMAQGFWESGLVDTQATFNAFFRENPFGGGYAVACGMGQIPELAENFVFGRRGHRLPGLHPGARRRLHVQACLP